jgi:hypothetical protein
MGTAVRIISEYYGKQATLGCASWGIELATPFVYIAVLGISGPSFDMQCRPLKIFGSAALCFSETANLEIKRPRARDRHWAKL